MDKKKAWIVRFLASLFMISVSVTVLPCGMINVHGLFGEITASTSVEDKDQPIANIKSEYHKKIQNVKGINIINIWFELMILMICISFLANFIKLPPGDTIVTLKVRIDD